MRSYECHNLNVWGTHSPCSRYSIDLLRNLLSDLWMHAPKLTTPTYLQHFQRSFPSFGWTFHLLWNLHLVSTFEEVSGSPIQSLFAFTKDIFFLRLFVLTTVELLLVGKKKEALRSSYIPYFDKARQIFWLSEMRDFTCIYQKNITLIHYIHYISFHISTYHYISLHSIKIITKLQALCEISNHAACTKTSAMMLPFILLEIERIRPTDQPGKTVTDL